MTFPAAYALTLAVELPVLIGAMWLLGWFELLRWPLALLVSWLVNLTHPVLWWLLDDSGLEQILLAEVIVVVVEGAALFLLVRWLLPVSGSPPPAAAGPKDAPLLRDAALLRDALLMALLANCASFGLGLLGSVVR